MRYLSCELLYKFLHFHSRRVHHTNKPIAKRVAKKPLSEWQVRVMEDRIIMAYCGGGAVWPGGGGGGGVGAGCGSAPGLAQDEPADEFEPAEVLPGWGPAPG